MLDIFGWKNTQINILNSCQIIFYLLISHTAINLTLWQANTWTDMADKTHLSYGNDVKWCCQVYIGDMLLNYDHIILAVNLFPSGCASAYNECRLIWAVSASWGTCWSTAKHEVTTIHIAVLNWKNLEKPLCLVLTEFFSDCKLASTNCAIKTAGEWEGWEGRSSPGQG